MAAARRFIAQDAEATGADLERLDVTQADVSAALGATGARKRRRGDDG